MATPEEERAIRAEINQLIRTYIDLLKQAGISQNERNRREKAFNETLSKAGGNLSLLNDLQSDLTIEVNNTSAAVRAMNDDFEGVSKQLGDIVTDLGNTGDLGRKILSTFKSLRNTTDKIRDDRDLTRVLSEKQLKAEKENLNVQQKRLDREIERGLRVSSSESNINKLRANGNDLAADALVSLKTGNTITEDQLEALRNTEGALIGLSGKEKERVLEAISFNKITGKTLSNYTAIEAQIEKALQREKQLTKNMGLTSSIVEGLGKLPGLNRVFKAEDIEEVKNLAREALVEQTSLIEQANEARAAGNDDLAQALELQASQVELTNRGSIASKILGKSFGNLKETLTDPATILTAIGTTLFRIDGLIAGLEKGLGVSRGAAQGLRDDFEFAAGASNDIFVNSTKLQDSFFKLKQEAGVFFDITSQSSETFLNLTERLDLAGSSAANLTTLFRLQGKDTETIASNMFDSTNAMLQTSKTTASVKDILGDIGESSKGLQASLSANPGALAKAAVAARELGATLKDIEGIQKSLLDFEGSISAELEAELLTGKQLNLEKARMAALNNDLETVGKELGKQGIDLASFSNMNAIQQEKMAAAMGLSRDAMGEMLLKQQTQNMTLSEVRDKFGEQTYEQAKALSTQEKFNAAVEKVKDLFGSVMTVFAPIIDIIGMIVQPIAFIAGLIEKLNKLTGGFSNALIGVAIVAKALGANFGNVGSMVRAAFKKDTYTGFFSGIQDRFKGLSSPLKTLGDKLKGVFGGAADASKGIQFDPRMAGGGRFRDMTSGRMVSEEAANAAGVFKPGAGPTAAAASGATDAAGATGATPAPADDGKALKEKMQNIAEGIKSFADMEVVKGALAMVIAAPGLIALGIASLPLKITEKINGKALQASMKGIANGLKAFANPQVVLGGLALIPISLALATMAVGAIGLGAIALLGAPAAAGMVALTAGLTALGTAAATGVPFLGVALIGAFGLALIPFGAALGLAAPAIEAIGTTIATVIMAIADAVVTVIPALTQSLIDLSNNVSISGLLGLALALPSLAMGIGALALSIGGAVLAAISLKIVTSALEPLAEMAPKFDLTNKSLKGIATSIALLATSLNTLDAAKLETLSDFEGNINISTVTTSTTDQASVATNTVDTTTAATTTSNVNTTDQASIATNVATNTVDQASIATNTVDQASIATNTVDQASIATNVATNTVDQASIATNVATNTVDQASITTNTVDQANTIASTINEPVSSLANLITKQSTSDNTEIVPGISVTTPPTTTTQEVLTTNTENLSTSTSNAATELETFTEKINSLNISESTKQTAIKAKANALGVNPYTEAEVIDLDAKKVTNEIVQDIPVTIPPSTTTQEVLTTNTENLATTTSNATTSLEEFTAKVNTLNLSESTKSKVIETKSRALGIKPEIEVIDLDAKNIIEKLVPSAPTDTPLNVPQQSTELVPGISVNTPDPETTTISSLERVLTLNTNEINTAIGLLNETQTNRSINTDTLDILKAKAALVDLRDGQQDIPSEKFSPKSLEIVEKVVNTIVKLGTNTELQQIGEKIGGAEITNTNTIDGSNKSESVRFFKAQESSFSVVEPKTQKVETSTSDIFNNTTGTQETSNNTIQQGITAEEVEGIVSTTIKNLVPEMVAALNNIKVVNDNFNNSKQSEGPSRNRNIVNNNFA